MPFAGTVRDGSGPCPECGSAWSYTFTWPGWDGSLPCTRAVVVADGVNPVHLRCPDCGACFSSTPPVDTGTVHMEARRP